MSHDHDGHMDLTDHHEHRPKSPPPVKPPIVDDCDIVGTKNDDELVGTPQDDCIAGVDGDDLLRGLAGDDRLLGGRGDDELDGGRGNDKLDGGKGADLIAGATGGDKLKGDDGDDVLFGHAGTDHLSGGRGSDVLDGGPGPDSLVGGDGVDLLAGGAGSDVLKGGPGDDMLIGAAGDDELFGGEGGDRFVCLLDTGPEIEGVRGSFIQNLTEGRFLFPVIEQGGFAAFPFESQLVRGSDTVDPVDVEVKFLPEASSVQAAGVGCVAAAVTIGAISFFLGGTALGIGLEMLAACGEGAALVGTAHATASLIYRQITNIREPEDQRMAIDDLPPSEREEVCSLFDEDFAELRGICAPYGDSTAALLTSSEDIAGAGNTAEELDSGSFTGPTGGDFVADLVLVDRFVVGGTDITDQLIGRGEADIIAPYVEDTVVLSRLPDDSDLSISFLDPALFSPVVHDRQGKDISDQVLGVDTVLIRSGDDATFGYVVYNDPTVTGRELTPSDKVSLDPSAFTSAPIGSTVEVSVVPVTVADSLAPNAPNGPFGNDILRDFEKGADRIEIRGGGDFAFDDLSLTVVGRDTVIDLSEQFDDPAGTDTITVAGVTNLDVNDFLFI